MNKKKTSPYSEELSTRSLPLRPGWPSHNNLEKWRHETSKREEAGLQLLFAHYGIATEGGTASAEQLRELTLALAREHVPYFKSRRRKVPRWDIELSARFLHDVQAELKKGKPLAQAVKAACPSPPDAAKDPNVESLLKRYRDVRARLGELVYAGPSGELTPLGEEQSRLWTALLEPDDSVATEEDSQPCPDHPDDIVVDVQNARLPTNTS